MEKKITLQQLKLENFKGFQYRILDFNSANASIYGDNAAGKTTVYDGLTWLLFGKDSRGQKDFDIKPLDENGQVIDHSAITAVDATLLVNGVSVCLRRTYFEKWSTKRGSSEKTFDGHSSDYFVDGVPCKKGEFERRVAELVDENKFMLLTSVNFFPEIMGWQARREVLFQLAGIQSDREIMAMDDRFAPLLTSIGNGSLEDYKKRLTAERRGLNTRRTDIPARISENRERIRQLMELDFAAIEAEVADLQHQRDQVQEAISLAKSNNLAASLRVTLGSLQNELQQLEFDNAAYRKQQEVPDDREKLRALIAAEQNSIAFCARRTKMLNASIQAEEAKIEECRKAWSMYNGKTFPGAVCHTCGQPLIGEALERSRKAFEDDKERGKNAAVTASADAKAALTRYREELSEVSAVEAEATGKKETLEAQLRALGGHAIPAIEDMPGFVSNRQYIREKIDQVNGQIFSAESGAAQQTSALRTKAREIDAHIARLRGELAKKNLLSDLNCRVEELHQDAQTAADALNAIDQMLFLCDEYTRYKVGFVEDSVNSLFLLAKFRLFRDQMNGGVEDRCDVTYNGIPYGSLNNGARINVGLDIIRTLSRAYGISVPLFVDNAEGVTRLESTGGQVIRLVVSENDKELRCEYEN